MSEPNKLTRIIILSNLFPTPTEPERGIFTYQTVKEIAKIHPVVVVCPLPWFPRLLKKYRIFSKWSTFVDVPAELENGSIKVYYPRYLLLPKISDAMHGMLLYFGIASLLNRLFNEKQNSVLSAHWLYPDCMSAALYKRIQKNVPLVTTILGCDLNRDIKIPVLAAQIRFTMRTADKIVTVSEALRKVAINEGIDSQKVVTIVNGVDQNLFTPFSQVRCRKELNLPLDRRLIIVVGQLVPVKDHMTFILGMSHLRKQEKFKDVRAVFIGEGFLREKLLAAIHREGLDNIITLQGQVRHDYLPTWFSAADLFCLPSIREGMPNVILESLASGCPVVASTVGGISEVITKKNGRLFQPGDAKELASQLEEALQAQWTPATVRATVFKYTWEMVARKYHDIYSEIGKFNF